MLIFLTFYLFDLAFGRGRMINPPHRGSMWRFGHETPPDYNDMSLNCGGIAYQWGQHKGKCGLCGDSYGKEPYEHELNGKFATGKMAASYTQAQVISITIELTANKQGWFEFRLCSSEKTSQECFDEHLLQITSDNTTRYLVKTTANGNFTLDVKLPSELTCTHCVLQFKYHAGNNYGKSKDGKMCLGCAEEQEELYNCADVTINPTLEYTNILESTQTTPENTFQITQKSNKGSKNFFNKMNTLFVILAILIS